jgi:hypothetical protein
MGWCSATDIMDAALDAARAAVTAALLNVPLDALPDGERGGRVTEALRPFVRTLARKLHEQDWDCVDESRYFEDFAQEMHDHTDSEHLAWLVEMIKDTDGDPQWTARLAEHRRKMEQSSGR